MPPFWMFTRLLTLRINVLCLIARVNQPGSCTACCCCHHPTTFWPCNAQWINLGCVALVCNGVVTRQRQPMCTFSTDYTSTDKILVWGIGQRLNYKQFIIFVVLTRKQLSSIRRTLLILRSFDSASFRVISPKYQENSWRPSWKKLMTG